MNERSLLSASLNARHNEYRYLLLDPLKELAAWNLLNAEQLQDSLGSDALRRVLRPDLAWSAEHCPLLVLLASPGEMPDEALVQYSEKYARGEVLYEKRGVCGWLTSTLAPDAMAEWLAALCGNIKPGTTIPLFESLRLDLLQATADPVSLAGLLAAVSQWHWVSSAGVLQTLNGQYSEANWRLNWSTEQAQNDIRLLWRLLSSWRDASEVLPVDAARQAIDAWTMTGKVGLHHLSDRLYLALNVLTLPADITEHAAVQVLMQQASEDASLYFEQLMQTLPHTVWQEFNHTQSGKKEFEHGYQSTGQ
ncbi:hypothetical protein [uncultured Cedecea sp.]|uniref:hypothetical protein n=1 Tax=uncultured Cedecea sp. TaxID=988762 RepID=UPI0026245254|nr:hypothetical protein [uncultured Cedecea sp.]